MANIRRLLYSGDVDFALTKPFLFEALALDYLASFVGSTSSSQDGNSPAVARLAADAGKPPQGPQGPLLTQDCLRLPTQLHRSRDQGKDPEKTCGADRLSLAVA
ncbi:hypothetical protein THAOC_31589 [Thalassiosira oceanica]|uniref:Uncharacterized protein n=1 Tax=Thalassiosira oceanica TaxID=159749 RepID=K0R8X2_THAOC|nr:hypothetical protein THAOC_31589 [Thalassiosira oceanica]|eukprot:EJK49525.1 hypothetical protein THAOC_31589 [Thalassiosira oceanica]